MSWTQGYPGELHEREHHSARRKATSAVGTPVTRRPRHSPGRAVFPHPGRGRPDEPGRAARGIADHELCFVLDGQQRLTTTLLFFVKIRFNRSV